jgi:hypothetical protein
MAEGTPCTSCGSRRTTEIRPSSDGPVSIWCHACGTVTAKVEDTVLAADDAFRIHDVRELTLPWQRS